MSIDDRKEFWSLRRSIFLFRKVLIGVAIAGMITQGFAALFQYSETSFDLEGTDGFVGTFALGTILFVTGIIFLIKNNGQVDRIDRVGDTLYPNDPNWRFRNE